MVQYKNIIRNKSARLLIIICAVLVAASGIYWALQKFEIINKPTELIKELRLVEKSLDLPKPDKRQEFDECHLDFYRSHQICTKEIFYKYNERNPYEEIKKELINKGYEIQLYKLADGANGSVEVPDKFTARNEAENRCVKYSYSSAFGNIDASASLRIFRCSG